MIKPHGGELINRLFEKENDFNIAPLPKIEVDKRYLSDCEMIAIGAFSPLKGFMDEENVKSVLDNMQLKTGEIWTIPLVLPVPQKTYKKYTKGDTVALVNSKLDKNKVFAVLQITDKYILDLEQYASSVFQTADSSHPGVKVLYDGGNKFLGGDIKLINRLPRSIEDFYYLDPVETRQNFRDKGWDKVVAFQTRNPIHRAHEYLIKSAAEQVDGVLIHPLVGSTKKDDIPAETRMKCYETIIDNYFNRKHAMMSVFPAAMRYAGPKEAVMHMIARKNYGCSHMIIGRDHAGVGSYYGDYEAQELVTRLQEDLGIEAFKFEHAFYCQSCANYATEKTCPHDSTDHIHLSGTKVRTMLRAGVRLPTEFSRSEVGNELLRWAQKTNKKNWNKDWENKINIVDVINIAYKAGEGIMKIYEQDEVEVEIKEEDFRSPITIADRKASKIIMKGIAPIYGEIPILGEEDIDVPYEVRKDWKYFWLIDPLDGTKEFIGKKGEFTVNIALVKDSKPILGVVYAPVNRDLYFAQKGKGAFKINLDNKNLEIVESNRDLSEIKEISDDLSVVNQNFDSRLYTVLTSRWHINEDTEEYLKELERKHGKIIIKPAGSSLKMCLIAEGKADEYPRLAPTMEWDTAAAQVILEESGKSLIKYSSKQSLRYNKKKLRNPYFIAK